VVDGLRLLSTHDQSHYMVLQSHSQAFHVFDSCGTLLLVFLSA
jgi:hypothetical protein